MPLYIAGVELPDFRQNQKSVTDTNIERYKQQDLQRCLLSLEPMPTDAEYSAAEQRMQEIYNNCMEEN